MTQINNGGSAFPTARVSINGEVATDGVESYGPGMSLRDWFAGQVIAGLTTQNLDRRCPDLLTNLARSSYQLADAMLAARDGSASV